MREDGARKRIPVKKDLLAPIEDDQAYIKNKCSERAKKINAIYPDIVFEVWFDQHYQIRQQFGDDNGFRKGIDAASVESLVLRSMKHLVAYSAILNSFTFINHAPKDQRAQRIVLQEDTENGTLNVVIEAHLIEIDIYEITVKTAMQNDAFKISDGQFAVEIVDNESVLKRMERGRLREVYSL
jgi:hypothetical protein